MAPSSIGFFKNRNNLLIIIRILCLSALIFASALAVDYYFTSNTFCAQGHSCDTVAKSEFGQKYGIFLPTLGLVAYTFFFFFSFAIKPLRKKLPKLKKAIIPLFSAAIICCALGAVLFIIVQAIEINAFCWLCMGIDTSAIVMVLPAILLLFSKDDGKNHSKKHNILIWAGLYFLIAGSPITWGAFKPEQKLPAALQALQQEDKINVIEISSFDCPHCRQLHPQFAELIKSYGDKINFKRLTIPLRGRSEGIIAYHCAEQQSASEQYAHCMFDKPSYELDELLKYADECSIDVEAFKACLMDPDSQKAAQATLDIVSQSDFEGAPTVWIEETPIIGFDKSKGMQPYKDAIDKVASNRPSIFLRKPIIFTLNLCLAAFLIIFGFISRKKNKGNKDDENLNDGDSSENKAEKNEIQEDSKNDEDSSKDEIKDNNDSDKPDSDEDSPATE